MATRSSPKEPVTVPAEIQTRLEAAGLRRTLATRAVLGLFLANPQGTLSHAQALASLQTRGLDINRVTLYRLLERLAACGVLQRQTDDDARTWRFRLADRDDDGAAPRFECDACHRQFRLTGASEPARAHVHRRAADPAATTTGRRAPNRRADTPRGAQVAVRARATTVAVATVRVFPIG